MAISDGQDLKVRVDGVSTDSLSQLYVYKWLLKRRLGFDKDENKCQTSLLLGASQKNSLQQKMNMIWKLIIFSLSVWKNIREEMFTSGFLKRRLGFDQDENKCQACWEHPIFIYWVQAQKCLQQKITIIWKLYHSVYAGMQKISELEMFTSGFLKRKLGFDRDGKKQFWCLFILSTCMLK